LAEQLTAGGFQRDGNLLRREQGEVAVTVDLTDGAVTIALTDEQNLELERSCETRVYGETRGAVDAAQQRLEAELQDRLEREAEEHKQQLQREVTDRLERQLADLQRELDQAANRVTAEALKRKAAQLGRVKEISDDPQTGTLTIVVEV
jgi:DNA topoisomerase VI subunit B